jgi:hypothetical protein
MNNWAAAVVGAALAFAFPAGAIERHWAEGSARGFPALVDPESGKVIGRGTYVQLLNGDELEVSLAFDLTDGRHIEEHDLFRLAPGDLTQERWEWVEKRAAQVLRSYEVDLRSGVAKGFKRENGEKHIFSKTLKVDPRRTFAGSGFSLALKNLSGTLKKAGEVELWAVAFTPQPHSVKVKVRSLGEEDVKASGTTVRAEHYVIEPQIPWIARPFVKAPPNHVWFAKAPPPQFLRAEGPLAEPTDPIVRTEAQAPAGNPTAAR